MKKNMIESDLRPSGADFRLPSVSNARTWKRGLLALLVAFSLIGAPTVSMANDSAEVVGRESGLGAAAALSSLIYGPAKILYAAGGLVVGSFAWVFTAGDSDVASAVFTRSLKGTYVITPAMLTGDEAVEFIGREEDESRGVMGAVASVQPTIEAAPVEGSVTGYDAQGNYTETQPNYDDLGW